MITWTVDCPKCKVRQTIPPNIRNVEDAKKWAIIWQVEHNKEVHPRVDTKQEGSEEGS